MTRSSLSREREREKKPLRVLLPQAKSHGEDRPWMLAKLALPFAEWAGSDGACFYPLRLLRMRKGTRPLPFPRQLLCSANYAGVEQRTARQDSIEGSLDLGFARVGGDVASRR